jgi:hypothetical protein
VNGNGFGERGNKINMTEIPNLLSPPPKRGGMKMS